MRVRVEIQIELFRSTELSLKARVELFLVSAIFGTFKLEAKQSSVKFTV